ncbi:MAG: RNA methyltransferase [Chloroflexi bacterium]|nr:RNA methyltransferase [Chloroflexota bacterium]
MDKPSRPTNLNDLALRIRSLKGQARRSSGRYLAEGLRLVETAMQSGAEIEELILSQGFERAHPGKAQAWRKHYIVSVVPDKLFTKLADTVTPQGVMSVLPQPAPDRERFTNARTLVILDNLRDPGNLGTILRSAQATAVDGVVLSSGCVDAYSPKVVRSAMGAHFYVPLWQDASWEQIKELCQLVPATLADMHSGELYWQADWSAPTALIISNEAFGASPEAAALASRTVHLPMLGNTESLNAAMAATVLLYEILRQRSQATAQ